MKRLKYLFQSFSDKWRTAFMGVLNRSIISLTRNKSKSIRIFIVLFLLASMVLGTINLRQAIKNTENNLLSQLPNVVTIYSPDNVGVFPINQFKKIEQMPSVKLAENSSRTFVFSRCLSKFFGENNFLSSQSEYFVWDNISLNLFSKGKLERFEIVGIQTQNPIAFELEALELKEGRHFTEEELTIGENKVLISSSLAHLNNLSIGSVITLENNIYEQLSLPNNDFSFDDDSLVTSESISVKVIGIFETLIDFDHSGRQPGRTAWEEVQIQNKIFMPNKVIDQIISFQSESSQNPNIITQESRHSALFVVDEERNIRHILRDIYDVLPDGWVISELSPTLGIANAAIDNISWIFMLLQTGSMVAAFIIVGLIIILFLSERKKELEIYAALGMPHIKILLQFILDFFVVSMFAMSLAIITSNYATNLISARILENELLQQQRAANFINADFIELPPELILFRPSNSIASISNVLENHYLYPNILNNLAFLLISLATIFFICFLSIQYILKINMKILR
jgi:putative ABC transport system permease protein